MAYRATGVIAAALIGNACGGVDVENDRDKHLGPSSSTTQPGENTGCPQRSADCEHDGSCVALDTLENCGACGTLCSSTNATPSCTNGQCALACNAGYSDCNADPNDGCEASLANDPKNCGQCGNACGAGDDCFQSTCVRVLSSAPAALVGADSFVIDGESLVWGTPGIDAIGEVASVPLQGGPTVNLMSGANWPARLHSNTKHIVWSDYEVPGIYRMPLDGGAIETLWQGGGKPELLDIDDDYAYFTTGADVQRLTLHGAAPLDVSTVASGFSYVSSGHLDAGFLYITDTGPEVDQESEDLIFETFPNGSVDRVTLATNQVDILATGLDTAAAVTTHKNLLVWAESGGMATYSSGNTDFNEGSLGRIVKANLDGSNRTVVSDQQVQPRDVAVDDTSIYWANSGTAGGLDPMDISWVGDGGLMRAPIGGGTPQVLVPAIDARVLKLSSDAVFFATWNYGLVLRVSK